ncbi:MAG: FliM/FliN family flagellar motor switch protein [Aestuariivirga sp.]|jgi:flagellar motor switch protein FliN/FliY
MINETLDTLTAQGPGRAENSLTASFARVPVTLQVMLGSTHLPLSQLLGLQAGSMISLDQKLGEPVSVIVNGCKVASGQLFVMDDQAERLGVKITEIFSAKDAI